MDSEVLTRSPEVLPNTQSHDEPNIATQNQSLNKSSSSIDEDEDIFNVIKKRVKTFSDSGSDLENENKDGAKITNPSSYSDKSPDDEPTSLFSSKRRSRIKNRNMNSDSENENGLEIIEKKNYESLRTEKKKKNLKEKFKNLTKSKDREKSLVLDSNKPNNPEEDEYCVQIREILKSSVNTMKSICDPDTSDEEDQMQMNVKKKHKSKTVKSTSPKPQRMTAKQAMENMQKIKSESNRMLREKQVSLPYHRPKAFTLKDIMSRRKPAVSSDGKALPIKMNDEQLKQYAMMLEQRQKEVIELCKSDSEDEPAENEVKTDDNMLLDNKTDTESKINHDGDHSVNASNNEDKDECSIKSNEEIFNTENKESEVNPDQCEEEKMESEDNISKKNLSNNDDVEMECFNAKDIQQNKQSNMQESANGEDESQVMILHYGSEKVNPIQDSVIPDIENDKSNANKSKESVLNSDEEDSYANDINFDEIEKLIDAATSSNNASDNNKENEETLAVNNIVKTIPTPKLTGGPGLLIDLDDSDQSEPRKLTGVEILKERFTFFANLKTHEELEKDREKKYKPGTQHLKLKQELEQQISEQRSLEWEKRLEEEKQLKSEMNQLSDDDIEKIEAKLDSEDKIADESSESEEEPEENDVLLVDKPLRRNLMLDDEAEVSDCDEPVDNKLGDGEEKTEGNDLMSEGEEADLEDSNESSESSESEEEVESKPRKSRILKAFEDSDDESALDKTGTSINDAEINVETKMLPVNEACHIKETQDDDLQLAQENKSSEDLFSTQESNQVSSLNKNNLDNISTELAAQTFSIMNSVDSSNKMIDLESPSKISIDSATQSQSHLNLDHVVGMCSGSFSQNLVSTQEPPQLSQSQEIGDDIAVLCTGKFYDNQFVSQTDKDIPMTNDNSQVQFGDNVVALCTGKFYDNPLVSQNNENNVKNGNNTCKKQEVSKEIEGKENTVLKSILDELDDPEPKPNKYFFNSQPKDKINIENIQKKKLVIDSDEECNDNAASTKKIKKFKKRKAEQRALQFSDDEEDVEGDSEDYESEQEDRVVEYDSEENEVEVQPKLLKKKRRMGEFFENEAELTSEDEWVGSGDEDERGLDRMEREDGDDDTFHQGQLQRELGQIHMREVLDQDRREVRLLQELLFEDGDLGDGHRQRKFRWKNADGDIEIGTNPDEFADTQEDEFESEEQWRKQRHERETFLRKMQEQDQERENVNTSINRTTIIKANLNSRSMSTLISETTSKTETKEMPEKKIIKDIPSPKKPFTIFQQNYHSSLLTRGRGALARLAALATPLATDDAPVTSTNRRNFVFTAISDEEPKVTKRKAEQVNTPRLIKKMKTDQTTKYLKNSLLDHLQT